jgi:hypothetical protein
MQQPSLNVLKYVPDETAPSHTKLNSSSESIAWIREHGRLSEHWIFPPLTNRLNYIFVAS